MPNFPSIPLKGTDKNSKLFLDTLAGRMNKIDRVVTFADLLDAGVIELAQGVTIGDLDPNNPGSGITLPPGAIPQNPTTPANLGVSGSYGAMFLTWDYEAYNDEYGTEIHRNSVNDLATANLIAVGKGRFYTDNVGELTNYYYWVRNRSISGSVSGYNSTEGAYAVSNMRYSVADFILENPEAAFTPFTIVDDGEPGFPDWTIYLNGDVLVNGSVGIHQLTDGELPSSTTMTIGNNSLQLGTDGAGKGYLVITGNDGINGNDYLFLNAGILQTFIWDPNIGEHVQYKELRRVERGVITSGDQAIIPAYFKSEPTVQLSFEDISVYNPDNKDQAQSLRMSSGEISPHPTVLGSYVFTPLAQLVLAAGVSNQVEGLDSGDTSSDSDIILTSLLTHTNGQQFVSQFTVSSAKAFDAANYQNRQVLITMQGSLNGTAFITLATKNVNLSGSGTPVTTSIDSGLQVQGTWQLRYIFNASDRAGTESSGGASYTYEEFLHVTSGDTGTYLTEIYNNSVSFYIQSNRPSPVDPAMKLYSIDFKARIRNKVEAWALCIQAGALGCATSLSGEGKVVYPKNPTNNITYSQQAFSSDPSYGLCDAYISTGDPTYKTKNSYSDVGTEGRINISDNAEPYYSGRFSNNQVNLTGSVYDGGIDCFKGYGRAESYVESYDVSYYYRKPIVVSTTPVNRFKVDSVAADLGAQDISIEDATINWIAVGE